jgi:gliding motility-associated-like protein
MRISALFLLINNFLFAQNLVPNYSFETNVTPCPYINQGTIWDAPPWQNTNLQTPDLMLTCNTYLGGYYDVPSNLYGYQYAATGLNYAGIRTYLTGNANYREYISVQLTQILNAGETYYASFKISPGDFYQFASSNFSVYFSSSLVLFSSLSPFTPQLNNFSGRIVNDTANWTVVSGFYTAAGGEEYITIGNFLDDTQTTLAPLNPTNPVFGTYYFIDDVELYSCQNYSPIFSFGADKIICVDSTLMLDAFMANTTCVWDDGSTSPLRPITQSGTYYVTINTPCGQLSDTIDVKFEYCEEPLIPNVFTPNGDETNDEFFPTNASLKTIDCKIYNRWGTLVYEITSPQQRWDGRTTSGEECSTGVYYYIMSSVGTNEKNYSQRGYIHLIR